MPSMMKCPITGLPQGVLRRHKKGNIVRYQIVWMKSYRPVVVIEAATMDAIKRTHPVRGA